MTEAIGNFTFIMWLENHTCLFPGRLGSVRTFSNKCQNTWGKTLSNAKARTKI